MKTVYFHHGLWPSNSPSTTFVTYNAQGFMQAGLPLELVTVRNDSRPVPAILAGTFGIDGPLPVTLLDMGPLKRRHLAVYLRAFPYLLRSRFDVLITRNLSFLPFAFLLRRMKKDIKVVFETHDFYSDPALRHDGNRPKIRRKCSQEHRYLPRLDGMICVSEQQRVYYARLYPQLPMTAAVTGVKPLGRETGPRGVTKTLGYIGSFAPEDYDLSFLLNVLAAIGDREVKLVLAGARSGRQEKAVRDLAAAAGVSGRVEILPWLSPAELEAVKARIDIGCCPMVDHFFNGIKSPLKVLEYFSAGIPVLATGLGSFKFVVKNGHNGYLLEQDAQVWADAIMRIYGAPALYGSLSAGSLASAREFGWDRRAALIDGFCRELHA